MECFVARLIMWVDVQCIIQVAGTGVQWMTGLGPFYAWYFRLRESKVFQTGGLRKTISIPYHYRR